MAIDTRRYGADWLSANARIAGNQAAAMLIASRYGRDWKHGRRTAVCAASFNTPLWQEAVAQVAR